MSWLKRIAGIAASLLGGLAAGQGASGGEERGVCLYLARLQQVTPEQLSQLAAGAKVEEKAEGPNQSWSSVLVTWPDVELTLTRMDDAAVPRHLEGLTGYIAHMANEKMDPHIFSLMRRVHRSRHVIGVVAKPAFDQAGKAKAFLSRLAESEKAILFSDATLVDSQWRLLLGPENARNKEAKVPVFESAVQRKAKSEERLKKLGVIVPAGLPIVSGDEEAFLRTPADVAQRAIGLAAVAVRSEGMEAKDVLAFMAACGAPKALTPAEQDFVRIAKPTQEDIVRFRWRYECLYVMLWALGYIDDLGQPSKPCQAAVVMEILRDKFDIKKARLRPTAEILDAADFVYRCHWATMDARLKKKPAPPALNNDMIMEWHHTLNWLIRYMNQEWDEVKTDT